MDLTPLNDMPGLKTPNLITVLGMRMVPTPDPDTCAAIMPVDEHSRQPFGFLSGGATLALAETLAGAGSCALAPGMACVGLNVTGAHAKAVAEGHTVTALARIVKQGKHIHIWEVAVTDDAGELVSTVTVTNYIYPLQ